MFKNFIFPQFEIKNRFFTIFKISKCLKSFNFSVIFVQVNLIKLSFYVQNFQIFFYFFEFSIFYGFLMLSNFIYFFQFSVFLQRFSLIYHQNLFIVDSFIENCFRCSLTKIKWIQIIKANDQFIVYLIHLLFFFFF